MTTTPATAGALLEAQRRLVMQLAGPAAIFGAALVALLVVRRILLGWVRRMSAGPTAFPAVFAGAVRFPSFLWCLAGALALALRSVELTDRQERTAGVWIVVFLIASLSLVAAAVAVRMVTVYGERQRVPFAVAGLSRTLTYVVVLSIGAMVLLHYLGLNVTPLLTALGVGGLAVALALQDTLANFFAGIHLLVEEPISLGHFIRLATGEEGTVVDIGWRTTRVRTGANNIIVIPNSKIAAGILTNFDLPDSRVVVEIAVVAAHEADPEKVRRIILEEAAAAEDVLAAPAPLVLFDPGVTPTHMQYRLFVSVESPLQRGLVTSAINLRLAERFAREGVPMPRAAAIAVPRG